jgi:hypothetical protein
MQYTARRILQMNQKRIQMQSNILMIIYVRNINLLSFENYFLTSFNFF